MIRHLSQHVGEAETRAKVEIAHVQHVTTTGVIGHQRRASVCHRVRYLRECQQIHVSIHYFGDACFGISKKKTIK